MNLRLDFQDSLGLQELADKVKPKPIGYNACKQRLHDFIGEGGRDRAGLRIQLPQLHLNVTESDLAAWGSGSHTMQHGL